ncbi:LemA family protein [Alkalitalea saponilacus]|uniref:LemA protein n=1 Tax=Alkalitalea saponilacus TaxID=889453 RepID=A0A1T5BN78_9BACT|nr:LemA family protein [Alkalitalea saponilacus]ASB49648.1 LemA family protein [Alkalitalea saponilacus]SKB48595.1 LemA protein [Alkalitalea saponilacus]
MRNIRLIIAAIIVMPMLSSCGYNKMVDYSEAVDAQWAQVENVYQRRADLIPNLVATVRGYASHERETLEAVIDARSRATGVNFSPEMMNDASMRQFQEAQENLSSALSRLMVVVERYPDLKANENFRDLQAQLEGTENRIAVERNRFNEATRQYNAYIRRFPQRMVASIFSFERKPYFEADRGAHQAPQVEF